MRVVLRLVRELLRLLFFPLLALRRRRAAPAEGYVTLAIDGPVRDLVVRPPLLRRLLRPGAPAVSLHALGRDLDEASADPRVRGVLVTLTAMGGGMATAESLRGLLERTRARGKDVVVHLPLGGATKEAYVASAASRVFLGPQASLSPAGFATHVRYARRALDRAHVVPEVYARGRFKSAGEQIARDTMSAPQRVQLEALLDTFHGSLVRGLAAGRGMTEAEATAAIDGAPYQGDEARVARVADGVAYEDQLPGLLGAGAKGGDDARFVPLGAYAARRRSTRFARPVPGKVLGVIEVHGAIVHAGGRSLGVVATDEAVIAAARLARRNPRVAGVLLHVDSRGGSALASDRMHRELALLAAEKPVVACLGDVAASGGYYVAAPASAIVAQPTTVTGSIGVVGARVAIDPLLAHLGITTEVVKRGARSELLAATRPLDEEEQEVLRHHLEVTYQAFLAVVAAGRKRPVSAIAEVAEGRVWSGKDAKDAGLVDVLGGIDVALELLRSRVGAGAEAMEPAVLRPPPKSLRAVPAKRPEALSTALLELLDLAGVSPDALAPLWLGAGGERVLAWAQGVP